MPGPAGLRSVHPRELRVKHAGTILGGGREQPRDALGREEPGEDALALRPRRRQELLALGEPSSRQRRPRSSGRTPSRPWQLEPAAARERSETLRREAVDPDVVENADRKSADDCLRPESPRPTRESACTRSARSRSQTRQRGAARAPRARPPFARPPQRFPRRPASTPRGNTSRTRCHRRPRPCAARTGTTCVRSTRRRASAPASSVRTVEGSASTERSQDATETSSRRDASGCDHGSSGSTVAAT